MDWQTRQRSRGGGTQRTRFSCCARKSGKRNKNLGEKEGRQDLVPGEGGDREEVVPLHLVVRGEGGEQVEVSNENNFILHI